MMAAESPGSRLSHSQPSDLNIHPLDDELRPLTSLYDLLMKCHGPQGHSQILHNNCGGEITVTSCSDRILESLSVTKPSLKLITSALKEHIRRYCDGGLTAAAMCVKLIIDSIRMKIHQRLITEVLDVLLSECLNIVGSVDFCGRLKLSPDVPDKLVLSLFKSKPACLLFCGDLEHMCKLALEAHRDATEIDSLQYVTVSGRPVQDSRLINGVLYQTPEIPTYNESGLTINCLDGVILVALIQTSMAGDSETFLDVTYELTSDLDTSSVVLIQLTEFAEYMISSGAGVVICQKVVHPTVRKRLKEAGILVLDRLGSAQFSTVHRLVRGDILDPFSKVRPRLTSQLRSIEHVVINRKSFLHLQGVGAGGVLTVLLSHHTLQALLEVKSVFQSCIQVLRAARRPGLVLCGGGCWQTVLLRRLLYTTPEQRQDWALTLGCSRHQVDTIWLMFINNLRSLASNLGRADTQLMDWNTGHHFVIDLRTCERICCQCGGVEYLSVDEMEYKLLADVWTNVTNRTFHTSGPVDAKKVTLVDAYQPAIRGMETAVGIASMVLSIHNYIRDTN